MPVPFTQYLLPNGRRRLITIEVDSDVQEMAEDIIREGHRFEAEVLTTGEVSLTIFDEDTEEDVAIVLVRNRKGVREAVQEMIRGFTEGRARESS